MPRVITIDGPAGAGKSTVARWLSERLGWRLLDTGAMYRAATLAALHAGTPLEDEEGLGKLASSLTIQLPAGSVLLNGEDVTLAIRSAEVTHATRFLANSPSVRRQLVIWQRSFASDQDMVTEGRDQGTIVFPDAFRKFFLTASLQERARRRHAELVARKADSAPDLDTVCTDLKERDELDAARAIAPMKPAEDAWVVDTTGVALEDVVNRLEQDIRTRLERPESEVGR